MTILDQSLCLLDSVSPEAEIRFRRNGILSCRQLADEAERHFSVIHAERVRMSFLEMSKATSCGLADWFVTHLPVGHRVRALLQFLPDVTFYDIETDGLSAASKITCITTLKDGRFQTFVRGRNLIDFLDVWSSTRILVGFNSKRFDTPMILRQFGLSNVPAQIDLMDEARHWGFRGGLKSIEHAIGFSRVNEWCADGAEAIKLWIDYIQSGSEHALSQLLAYNREDVRSLWYLAKRVMCMSIENTRIHVSFPCFVL